MCAGTWIAERICAGQNAAVLLVWAFCVQHTQTLGRHAIDAPVHIALIIANGYRKSAIICTYQIDHIARLTSDCQRFFLTCVCRFIFGRCIMSRWEWEIENKNKNNMRWVTEELNSWLVCFLMSQKFHKNFQWQNHNGGNFLREKETRRNRRRSRAAIGTKKKAVWECLVNNRLGISIGNNHLVDDECKSHFRSFAMRHMLDWAPISLLCVCVCVFVYFRFSGENAKTIKLSNDNLHVASIVHSLARLHASHTWESNGKRGQKRLYLYL